MSYCSIDEAKSAGARGSNDEITQAIADAQERIDRYTGDVFEIVPLTIEADVDREGYAYLHRRIVTIDSVTWLGAPTPIDAYAYRISSSATAVGGRDRIELASALGWSDVTVLGAEPWNGGWAGFASRYGSPRVSVVGTFGWATVPGQIRDACAQLAAYLRGLDADAEDPTILVDVEGNTMPVVPTARVSGETRYAAQVEAQSVRTVRDRTTGYVAVDELLASYVREPVRIR
jgi:hypothetical protein